jgi:hypothetical protein
VDFIGHLILFRVFTGGAGGVEAIGQFHSEAHRTAVACRLHFPCFICLHRQASYPSQQNGSLFDQASIDFAGAARQIARVGPHCSRPAYPRHIAQALQFARASGGGLLAICLIPTSLSFGRGVSVRAFDDRPVSCRMQPSVVSLPMEMRNVLRQLDLPYRSVFKRQASAVRSRHGERAGRRTP